MSSVGAALDKMNVNESQDLATILVPCFLEMKDGCSCAAMGFALVVFMLP